MPCSAPSTIHPFAPPLCEVHASTAAGRSFRNRGRLRCIPSRWLRLGFALTTACLGLSRPCRTTPAKSRGKGYGNAYRSGVACLLSGRRRGDRQGTEPGHHAAHSGDRLGGNRRHKHRQHPIEGPAGRWRRLCQRRDHHRLRCLVRANPDPDGHCRERHSIRRRAGGRSAADYGDDHYRRYGRSLLLDVWRSAGERHRVIACRS